MSLIELSNINLKFNNKEVLKDFSLSIKDGEKILITGKSGKGKSTLLKILLGFVNFDDGNFHYKGDLVNNLSYRDIRKDIAYVNQDVTLRPGKVSDVLKEIASFSGNSYKGEFDYELASLFEFDIDLLDKDTVELSGGERQRLGIILSIMLCRDIFLLDEITSALDKDLKDKVVEYFANCKASVIVISHDSCWLNSYKFREVLL